MVLCGVVWCCLVVGVWLLFVSCLVVVWWLSGGWCLVVGFWWVLLGAGGCLVVVVWLFGCLVLKGRLKQCFDIIKHICLVVWLFGCLVAKCS